MSAERFPGAARLERRRLVRRIVLIGALVVLLIVSALLWPRAEQRGALRVATAEGDVPAAGVLQGQLQTDREADQVCVRVAADAGTALLRLPSGWSSDGRRLLDTSGAVAAVPGDTVLITGDPGEVGALPGCPGSGRIWSVASLVLPR